MNNIQDIAAKFFLLVDLISTSWPSLRRLRRNILNVNLVKNIILQFFVSLNLDERAFESNTSKDGLPLLKG